MKRGPAVACSIGSIDPTNAAGITADLAVYRAFGVAGTCAIAAVTAQNAREVSGVARVGASFLRRQLEAIWKQVAPQAVCIGLVPDAPSLRAIRTFLRRHRPPQGIVIDPVMFSSSGYSFYGAREIEELRELFPIATLVTPNVGEASRLAGRKIANARDAIAAARAIADGGCAVLVTGGHLPGRRCTDILISARGAHSYGAPRLHAQLRGSGGVLAAGITALLAQGQELEPAISGARGFVRRAFRTARILGRGRPQLAL